MGKVCSLRFDGRGRQVETLQGLGTPNGDRDVWKAGPRVGKSAQPSGDGNGTHSEDKVGAARVARQAEASALVCDGGCGLSGAGSSGAGGAEHFDQMTAGLSHFDDASFPRHVQTFSERKLAIAQESIVSSCG